MTFDGSNEIAIPFVVYGKVYVDVNSGTAGESVTVYLIVNEV